MMHVMRMMCVVLFFFVCASVSNAEEAQHFDFRATNQSDCSDFGIIRGGSCPDDFGIARHDIKKIFSEINEKANRYNNWQELFPGWSEEEVLNYFEVLELVAIDYDLTQEGIARYGVNYEMNPLIRGMHGAGVNPGSLLLPVSGGLYVILKNMNPTERRLTLLLVGAAEYWAIGTHAPNDIAPDPRALKTMTILRIKF